MCSKPCVYASKVAEMESMIVAALRQILLLLLRQR